MTPTTPAQLYLPDARLVALVGAGGKTSLMAVMAAHALAAGETVIRTTTTKLAATAADPVFWDGRESSLPRIRSRLFQARALTLVRAREVSTGKLLGLAPEAVDLLAASGLADRILVEADGARGRPLKAPADHEPVIPRSTQLVIGIMGAEAFGAPIGETQVFRAGLLAQICQATPGQFVDEQILARLVANPQGLFKCVPPAPSRCILFVNKMDRAGADAWKMLGHARRRAKAADPDGSISAVQWFAGSVSEGCLRPLDED